MTSESGLRSNRICWSATTQDGARQIVGIVLSNRLPEAIADARRVLYRCVGMGEFQVSFTDHEGHALGSWSLKTSAEPQGT